MTNDPTQPPEADQPSKAARSINRRVLLRDMLLMASHQGYPASELMVDLVGDIWDATPHLPFTDKLIKPALEKGAVLFADHILEK
jgi:hypothetical protein